METIKEYQDNKTPNDCVTPISLSFSSTEFLTNYSNKERALPTAICITSNDSIPLTWGEMKLNNLPSSTISTSIKNEVLYNHVQNFPVKDRRKLFQFMKDQNEINHNTLFPRYGLTAGEFCVYYILTDDNRKKNYKHL